MFADIVHARRNVGARSRQARPASSTPTLHIILTTGYSAELMNGWGEDLDLQVLRKPYRQAELARVFREALQMPASGEDKADGSA